MLLNFFARRLGIKITGDWIRRGKGQADCSEAQLGVVRISYLDF